MCKIGVLNPRTHVKNCMWLYVSFISEQQERRWRHRSSQVSYSGVLSRRQETLILIFLFTSSAIPCQLQNHCILFCLSAFLSTQKLISLTKTLSCLLSLQSLQAMLSSALGCFNMFLLPSQCHLTINHSPKPSKQEYTQFLYPII